MLNLSHEIAYNSIVAISLTPYLRMKVTTYLAMGLGAILLLSSCKSSDDITCCGPPYNPGHYIQTYYTDLKEDGIFFEPNWTQLSLDESERIIEIGHNPQENQPGNALAMILTFNVLHEKYRGTPGHFVLFNLFANSIGDTHYTSTHYRSWLFDFPTAIGEKFQSVKLYTDQDYSSDFKAGSDVSSLFTVYFEDLQRTVQNNYQSVMEADTYQDKDFIINGDRNFFPHTISAAKLMDIDFTQGKFIGTKWYLKPHQTPDVTGVYTFTIEIKKENGKIVQKQTEPFYIETKNQE